MKEKKQGSEKLKKSGFTLVELIVVVALMGILGLIFTNTLIQTLRGQNKVKVINEVKQNGQTILDRLTNDIRQAEKIVCRGKNLANAVYPENAFDTIVIVKAGTYTRFRLIVETEGSNGYIQRDEFTAEDIANPDEEILLCSNSVGQETAYALSDKDPVNGVSLSYDGLNPVFNSESPLPGYSDVVVIKFRASEGVKAGNFFESSLTEGGLLFSTKVLVKGGK